MAYILGFIYADGSLEDAPYIRAKYLRVTNTDLDRIQTIKRILKSDHKIVTEEKGGNYKPRHLLRIGSHKLYDRLVKIGVTPRKSLVMIFPDVPNAYFGSFVRGYFDGDGCAYLEIRPTGRPKRLLTVFTSGSKVFLEALHFRLEACAGIKGRGLYRHGSTKGTYQLRYSSEDSIRLFKLMYKLPLQKGLFLQRKYDIFTRYFKLHSSIPLARLKFGGLMVKG